jgi:hypothetical protein
MKAFHLFALLSLICSTTLFGEEHPLSHYEPFEVGELLVQDIQNNTTTAITTQGNIAFIFEKYIAPENNLGPSPEEVKQNSEAAYNNQLKQYQTEIASLRSKLNVDELNGLNGFDLIASTVLTSNQSSGFGAPVSADKLVHIEQFQVQFYFRDKDNECVVFASVFKVNSDYSIDKISAIYTNPTNDAFANDFETNLVDILDGWDYEKAKTICGETLSGRDEKITAISKVSLTENPQNTVLIVAPEPLEINGKLHATLTMADTEPTAQRQLALVSARLSDILSSGDIDNRFYNHNLMSPIQIKTDETGNTFYFKPIDLRSLSESGKEGVVGDVSAIKNLETGKWEIILTLESGGGFQNPFKW